MSDFYHRHEAQARLWGIRRKVGAKTAIAQLVRMPGIGSFYLIENPRLQGLRKWAVKNFKKYLIFYFE